jgi:ABC-type antimicrobial peptide transport system permease subunit
VFGVATLQENFMQQQWPFRVFGTLFAIFALIALLLSSMGLYAVMSYSVTRRTQEIGVRLAMGASSGNILLLVLSHGLRQLGIGLAIGLAGAFGLARVMKGLLVGVTPTDPATFAAISAVLIVVGVLACWIPARWAMKMDPTMALRYE